LIYFESATLLLENLEIILGIRYLGSELFATVGLDAGLPQTAVQAMAVSSTLLATTSISPNTSDIFQSAQRE
jgi:hypothetical protein